MTFLTTGYEFAERRFSGNGPALTICGENGRGSGLRIRLAERRINALQIGWTNVAGRQFDAMPCELGIQGFDGNAVFGGNLEPGFELIHG